MMKKCELCKLPARLYCESDQASLCSGCDLKVHEANFLVARHSRRLLCKTCQAPTPWEAAGAKLGNTVTECQKCVDDVREASREDDEDCDGSGESDNDEEDEDEMSNSEDEEGEEEEGENQVVPGISPAASTPPPAASSSSSSTDELSSTSSTGAGMSRKRDTDRLSENEGDSFMASKLRRTTSGEEGCSRLRSPARTTQKFPKA